MAIGTSSIATIATIATIYDILNKVVSQNSAIEVITAEVDGTLTIQLKRSSLSVEEIQELCEDINIISFQEQRLKEASKSNKLQAKYKEEEEHGS